LGISLLHLTVQPLDDLGLLQFVEAVSPEARGDVDSQITLVDVGRPLVEVEMERSYISDLERGTRNPSVRTLGRLAQALDVEPKALLDAAA